MTSIAANNLPSPSRVSGADESVVAQSGRGGVMLTHEPDPEIQPTSYTLHYDRALAPVADAVRRHYDEHAHEDFDWTPPGAANPERVMHASPPTISWQSPAQADCQVYLETVPAY